MNNTTEKLKQQIKLNSFICGISSYEVSFAKSLVENKCKDKTLFVCEGLWAVEKLIEKGLKVIDLSGDFRYDDIAVYEKWYKEEHSSPELLGESVYGLCELHREEIKKARA